MKGWSPGNISGKSGHKSLESKESRGSHSCVPCRSICNQDQN